MSRDRTWEYRIENKLLGSLTEQELGEWDHEGWELVSVSFAYGVYGSSWVYHFRRRVPLTFHPSDTDFEPH